MGYRIKGTVTREPEHWSNQRRNCETHSHHQLLVSSLQLRSDRPRVATALPTAHVPYQASRKDNAWKSGTSSSLQHIMAPVLEASVVPAQTINGQVAQTTMGGQTGIATGVVVQRQPGVAGFTGQIMEVPPQQQFQQQQYMVGAYGQAAGQAVTVPQEAQQQFQQQQFQQQGIVQAQVVQAVPGVRVVSAHQPYIQGVHVVHMPPGAGMPYMGSGSGGEESSEHPLLPPGTPKRGDHRDWRYSLDPRCCQPECWVAWCCMCCPLGQIASKMNKISETKGRRFRTCWSYQSVVGIAICIELVLIFSDLGNLGKPMNATPPPSKFAVNIEVHLQLSNIPSADHLFNLIVALSLRGSVRKLRQIRGNFFEDLCVTCFCTPCAVTQMVMEMWSIPSQTPGCDLSQAPAFRV